MTDNNKPQFIEKFFPESASFRTETNEQIKFRMEAEKISPSYVMYTKETKDGKFVRMYFVAPANSEVKGWR